MSVIVNAVNESIKDRLGKCYMLSYKHTSSQKGFTLVHGYITDRIKTGRTIDHAWTEKGGIAYDPVIDKEFPKDLYYALYQAEKVKEYSDREANSKALSSGHYGPWHKIDQSKIKFP